MAASTYTNSKNEDVTHGVHNIPLQSADESSMDIPRSKNKPLQSVDESTMDITRSDTTCGLGSFQPACFQIFAKPLVFTAHVGIVIAVFLSGLTYLSGILTTLERQFQLSSSEVAALAVLNDAVSLSLVIVMTYFAEKSHRPRWIASGAILLSIAFILCALPHYLSGPIDYQSQSLTSSSESPLAIGQSSRTSDVCNIDLNFAGDMYDHVLHNSTMDECAEASNLKGLGSVMWLVIGQVLMGVASAPILPITLSYIDDAVKAHKLTSYSGEVGVGVCAWRVGWVGVCVCWGIIDWLAK